MTLELSGCHSPRSLTAYGRYQLPRCVPSPAFSIFLGESLQRFLYDQFVAKKRHCQLVSW